MGVSITPNPTTVGPTGATGATGATGSTGSTGATGPGTDEQSVVMQAL